MIFNHTIIDNLPTSSGSLRPKSSSLIFVAVFIILLSTFASGLIKILIRQYLSPLRRLRCPPTPSMLWGNLMDMHDQENNYLIDRWEEEYGPVFAFRGFLSGSRLMTTDIRAVAYILGNAYDYPKPDFVRDGLASMAAGHDGLLTTEGEQHTRQRKILQPAFSASSLRAVTPVFWEKAAEIRDIWSALAEQQQESHRYDAKDEKHWSNGAKLDVLAWLGRATLDVIGLAGFGYSFDALSDNSNALADAFAAVFATASTFRFMIILATWFPILRKFRREESSEKHMRKTIRDISLQLIDERRAAAQIDAQEALAKKSEGDIHSYSPEPGQARDLLGLLMRSNFAVASHLRMSTSEILCQISTFIAAGHETSASALTWTLYALAKSPEVQSKLRASFRPLQSIPIGDPQLDDELTRLPYLDWVVREVLRLHSPVTNTMRVCKKAHDAIPVGAPGGYLDRDGQRRTSIKIKKGDIISVPIQAINRSRAIWGPDAREFRPERWAEASQSRCAVPGLWSNILTFLNGNTVNGNRSCIGYKFAILEIKVFLFVLLRDLEFSIDPTVVIEKKINVVTRPCVKSEPERGNQMPLFVRRVPHDSEWPVSPPPPPF